MIRNPLNTRKCCRSPIIRLPSCVTLTCPCSCPGSRMPEVWPSFIQNMVGGGLPVARQSNFALVDLTRRWLVGRTTNTGGAEIKGSVGMVELMVVLYVLALYLQWTWTLAAAFAAPALFSAMQMYSSSSSGPASFTMSTDPASVV